jgi:hypothetical protein
MEVFIGKAVFLLDYSICFLAHVGEDSIFNQEFLKSDEKSSFLKRMSLLGFIKDRLQSVEVSLLEDFPDFLVDDVDEEESIVVKFGDLGVYLSEVPFPQLLVASQSQNSILDLIAQHR